MSSRIRVSVSNAALDNNQFWEIEQINANAFERRPNTGTTCSTKYKNEKSGKVEEVASKKRAPRSLTIKKKGHVSSGRPDCRNDIGSSVTRNCPVREYVADAIGGQDNGAWDMTEQDYREVGDFTTHIRQRSEGARCLSMKFVDSLSISSRDFIRK